MTVFSRLMVVALKVSRDFATVLRQGVIGGFGLDLLMTVFSRLMVVALKVSRDFATVLRQGVIGGLMLPKKGDRQ